jgi:hypothetical protein
MAFMDTLSDILQGLLIGGFERQVLLSCEALACRQQKTFEMSASPRSIDMKAIPHKASHSHIWCLPGGQFDVCSVMVPVSTCLNSGRS